MPFCINCGQRLADGAKFCSECGMPTSKDNMKRMSVYDGVIHKCPNCGENIDSFMLNCPTCHYELRGVESASSVKELHRKLAEIESQRETRKSSASRKKEEIIRTADKIDEQKANLISSFPIPNTREDLLEFIYLAQANINIDLYKSEDYYYYTGNPQFLVSNAWKAKFEQAYHKAEISFPNDIAFSNIQKLYEVTNNNIKVARNSMSKDSKILLKSFLIIMGVLVSFIIACGFIIRPIQVQNENQRLEAIVVEVESALENKEYRLALMNAESLEYQGPEDIEQERKWSIKREFYVDKVLNEAKANGVILEQTDWWEENSFDIESDNIGFSGSFVDGFVSGFTDGVNSGIAEAQENINEFNSILSNVN